MAHRRQEAGQERGPLAAPGRARRQASSRMALGEGPCRPSGERARRPARQQGDPRLTRQIILDTETTGLNAKLGDRIIEIGCIEIASRRFTERNFHAYLNPGRDIDEGAMKVHGLSREFLADKPRFPEVAPEFLEYIRGAELLIHNA